MTEEAGSTLVMDTGSYACRLGLSIEDAPRLSPRTTVGLPRGGGGPPDFGREALERRTSHTVKGLLSHSGVEDWERLEQFWAANLAEMQLDLSQTALLSNFYPHFSKHVRERSAQIFFENFNVPYYFTISNPLLVVYSSGKTTGLVLDSGHSTSSVVPVFDGAPHYWAQTNEPAAGARVSELLGRLLPPGGRSAHEVKERENRVALDFAREAAELERMKVLPDGTPVDAPLASLRAAESLFAPREAGLPGPGLAELVAESLSKTEPEFRRELLSSLLVAGGNTGFINFNERLVKELSHLVPSTLKVKASNHPEKTASCWYGGAVVASLSTFHPMWVSRADYEENGPTIVSRKSI